MKPELKLFKNVMYDMFKEGTLPDLDLEDFSCMWKALMQHWNIKMSDEMWEKFIDEINCLRSEDYEWFSEKFKEHFKN